jgi:CubicO group peptidase (beta-lactamase class C family)
MRPKSRSLTSQSSDARNDLIPATDIGTASTSAHAALETGGSTTRGRLPLHPGIERGPTSEGALIDMGGTHPVEPQGWVRAGFDEVREEFARNFSDRGEVGAAFAAVVDDELVVDLWGGDAAPGVSWQPWTLSVIFSGTKGLAATSMMILIDRGQIHLDDPVARYWPEFAAQGKEGVLIRHVLAHEAGLPGIRAPLGQLDVTQPRRMARLLAAQAPEWPPGSMMCYHPLTFGWLCDEVIRRVDGRSLGQFFRDEVAELLGLEVWIGLPEQLRDRVARLQLDSHWGTRAMFRPHASQHDALLMRVWGNPPLFDRANFPWNSRAFHVAEIPAANAIATARSLARLYACLASGGTLGAVRLLSTETAALAGTRLSGGRDPLTGDVLAWSTGFALQGHPRRLGPPDDAFGAGGAGGSVSAAWPTERVGVSYLMNLMREETENPRADALLDALHRCVRRVERVGREH